MRLPSVSEQDYDDDDEEQPSAGRDADDGRKGEEAVGPDVNFSWRDVKPPDLDLCVVNEMMRDEIMTHHEETQLIQKLVMTGVKD